MFHIDQQKIPRKRGHWQILKSYSVQSQVIGWHTKLHNHFYAFFLLIIIVWDMLMRITKPIKQPREEKNQTEIKISKYHQVCLSLSQLKETPWSSLANSSPGRLAFHTMSQQTVGTCLHLCICPHGAIQSCPAATKTFVQQKGSHDLANSHSKIRESNTAITLSGHAAFSRYPGTEVAETSTCLWHPKQTPK